MGGILERTWKFDTCDLFALRGQVVWRYREFGMPASLTVSVPQTACLNCRTEGPFTISFCLENKRERLNLMWEATRPILVTVSLKQLPVIIWCFFPLTGN